MLMAKAVPDTAPAKPAVPEPAEAPPVRPRTLAAAQAMKPLNEQSALAGARMRQDGGVKRFSVQSSLDVRASPFGAYDAKFVSAVQQCWYGLLDEQRYSLDRLGKVVVDFHLTSDGRITEMKLVESNVGDIYGTLCQLAISKPAPYEKWPPDMRRMVGNNFREVRFTFYY
jgi:hypothetical protein